ncbi:hypothetical protein FRC19_004102, partial [Serendipita sp. 401]
SQGASTATFVTALTFNAIVFGAEILVFTLVRRRFKVIYEPRSFLTSEGKRQQPLSNSLLGWPLDIWRADHYDIRHHNGMDAFFFVHFLRMMARIFLPIWIISWIVLLPITGAGNTNGLTGLERFTFGNVRREQLPRYSAHVVLIWGFTIWILYNIKTEMATFIKLRQEHLVDPVHSASAQANTILVTGVPRMFLDENAIARLFAHLPGGVKKVWLNRDLKELPDVYDRRLKAANKLESAEIALLKTALKLNKKANKGTVAPDNHPAPTEGKKQSKMLESATAHPVDAYVPPGDRPTHRLPVLGFLPFGKKVDTIEWATKEIQDTTEILEKERALIAEQEGRAGEKYPPLNSGILPPVALAILMMLLPIVLRLFGHFEGIPRKTGIELSLMTRFFIFQVVHGFLVTTISGSITSAIEGFSKNPTQIPMVLAQRLPTASTFFLTYAILQALSGTAGGLLQIAPLVIYYVKLFILGSTPRSVYSIRYDLRDVFFGTLFPTITLLVVISFGYSLISPVINGLAWLAFALFYFVWKYLFLWQLDQPASGDTGGLFFPKAIQHMFVGLYIQQICLAALFFLLPGGKAMGGVTVALIIVTAFFHMVLNNSYKPLLYSLPLTLAHKSYGMPQTGEGDDTNEDESADFGGDASPTSPSGVKASKKREESVQEEKILVPSPVPNTSHVQHNQGPGPTKDYGASVPVEGKRNEGPTDFNHPASVEPQRIIWIPEDPLGIGKIEADHLNSQGVEA